MAKALKQDIDKLRAAGEAAATGHIGEVPKARRATDPEEIFNRVLGRCVLSAACPFPPPLGPNPLTSWVLAWAQVELEFTMKFSGIMHGSLLFSFSFCLLPASL